MEKPTDPRFDDLEGRRFERLTVTRYEGRKTGSQLWSCVCDCGNTITTRSVLLKRGKTKSCGCLKRDRAGSYSVTHGEAYSSEYEIWCGMKKRCYNENSPAYDGYGGRGITMCDSWRNSFAAFLADMGRRPTPHHTIDRVDNDGAYCLENCRWATRKQQARNRRSSRLISHDGRTQSLQAWADETGIGWSTIKARLDRGWCEEKALTTPPRLLTGVNDAA